MSRARVVAAMAAGVACAGLAALLGMPGSGSFADEPRVQTDEFLFPLPGTVEANLAQLARKVEEGAGPEVQALYGIQLLAHGEYAAARHHCTEALAAGKLYEPLYCMSLVAYAEQKLEEAERYAEEAAGLRPGSAAPYLVLANVHKSRHDKAGLVAAIERGARSVPDRASFWEWELAKMLEEMGDIDGALQCLGTLATLTPDDPKVFTQAGDWLVGKGRLPDAARMYRLALGRAPWYESAALAFLEVHRTLGQWAEVMRGADEFLGNRQLVRVHARVRVLRDEARRALLFERVTAIGSKAGVDLGSLESLDMLEPAVATEVLLEAAGAAVSLGSCERSLVFARRAQVYSPGDARVRLAMGEAQLACHDLSGAAQSFRQSLDVQPSAAATFGLARVAYESGDGPGCIVHGEKTLEMKGDDLAALMLVALCHRGMREGKEELKALEQARRVSPDDPEVLRELVGYWQHEKGGAVQAASYLRQLVRLEPTDYPACLKLAGMEEAGGRKRDALSTLAGCMENLPPFEEELAHGTFARMLWLIAGMRERQAAVTALTRVCAAKHAPACEELKRYTAREEGKKMLEPLPYVVPRKGTKKVGELERLGPGGGDFVILGLEAPGFAALPLRDKAFLYYMSEAAIAGDDLLYVQNHRHALLLKQLFERLFMYRQHLPPAAVEPVHTYLKYLWVNHGNYDHRSGRKLVPQGLTVEMLKECMATLQARGEAFDFIPGESVEEKLAYVKETIFEAAVEPELTVSGAGKDVVLESAVNHYAPGVTDAMIAALPPALQSRLAVRFALRGGEVVAQTYRVGELGGEELARVVSYLGLALPYASGVEQERSIEELVTFYTNGDEDAFRRHSLSWLKTKGPTDYLNGFIEQLKDPRGTIGNYEGMAAFVADAAHVDRLADSALWFEQRMPWPDEYKRDKVERPVSNVEVLLTGAGDMGPVPWAGYNLPNYDDIRTSVGSKNVIFVNILTAQSEKERDAILEEFYLPEHRAAAKAWGQAVREWSVYLHEIIGHGSGKAAASLKEDPRAAIGGSYSTLEEARADLVALYFLGDDKLVELGAWPAERKSEVVTAAYVGELEGFLLLHRKFQDGVISEAHWKGAALIANYLLKGGEDGKQDFGCSLEEVNGKVYARVTDTGKMREGIARLLARVQVIKSTGDRKGAEELVGRFGTFYEERYRQDMTARAAAISLAKQAAFVFPRLSPVLDRKGNIVDVKIFNDEDLTAQHLRWSGL